MFLQLLLFPFPVVLVFIVYLTLGILSHNLLLGRELFGLKSICNTPYCLVIKTLPPLNIARFLQANKGRATPLLWLWPQVVPPLPILRLDLAKAQKSSQPPQNLHHPYPRRDLQSLPAGFHSLFLIGTVKVKQPPLLYPLLPLRQAP